MEKTEGRSKQQGSSPGSSSRRPYSLFSSIINLSSAPGVKTTDGCSSQQSPHTIPITRTNHHQKLSSDAPKKKKSNQSSSPGQSIASPRMGVNGPMGPAPRTLSILTALNELAISDRAGVIHSNPSDNHQDERKKGVSGKGNDDHGVNSHIYRRVPSSNHQSLLANQLKRDDLPSPATLPFSSMPRKLKGLERNSRNSSSPGSSHRAKSKERTPDWIWCIFQLAKHGRLEELQKSLKGLEPLDPTLIRHLVDEKGNTLLHCAARRGHILTLQWLVSILGPHTQAVLNDRNRAGRSVILTALKGGQLKCFQWLVLQSISGDKALVPKEGERSLLHFAANYGNDPAVRWLVEQLKKRNVPADLKDSGGMTPLHMAGKSGSVSVCHTLIVIAGADPFSQTELGWRPSDLALRHRHMKCANYLMMAEAASSLGSELSSLLSLYKNLQEEHESLRGHFREVLRVGKSLVKERVDLIKNFPSAGSKSSPEAELLLGGSGSNGARLSGLEHKLVKAEQAWKRMEQNQVDKFSPTVLSFASSLPGISNSGGTDTPPLDTDFTVENINSPSLLQKRLACLQSRQDKNFASEALLSASSSDAESTGSAASSSNDDQEHNRHHQDYYRQMRKSRSSSQQSFNPSDSSRPTTATAPWLLPPDDTLLSALSPIVSQIDGTARTPSSSTEFIPSLDLIQKGPSTTAILYSPTGTFGKPAGAKSQGSGILIPANTTTHADKGLCEKVVEKVDTPPATVLEVIEPSNKSVYFTPDLIRGTRHKPVYQLKSGEPVWNSSPTRSSSSINDAEDIYGQIIAVSGDQRSGLGQPTRGPKDTSVSPSPSKTNSWHRPGSSMESASRVTPSKSPSPSVRNSPRAFPQCSPFHLQKLSPGNPSPYNDRRTNEESVTSSFLYGPLSNSSPSASSMHLVHPSSFQPEQTSCKSEEIFEQFSPEDDNPENSMCADETDITSPSGQHGSASVSSSNTPVIKRSLSSVSRISSTVEIPFRHKNPWVSTDQLSFTTPESSLGGRLSPTPSESSRTESAFVPPSHTSQISELSKTESATEPTLSHYNIEHSLDNEEHREESNDMNSSDQTFSRNRFPTFTDNEAPEGEGRVNYQDQYTVTKGVGESSEAGNDTKGESSMVPKENGLDGGESMEGSKIVEEARQWKSESQSANSVSQIVSAPCISRPGGSTGIHKATIQRVTKSTRGPPKPWYEIEGSDDEGSHLLRVARTSRSSCLSASSFSDTENETTDDDHTCNPNCSQNNCPNCV